MSYLTVAYDPTPIFLEGLKKVFASYQDFELINTFNDFDDLIIFLNKNNTNILILDSEIKEKSGPDAIRFIHKNFPDIKILVLTHNLNEINIFSCIKAGANGYLYKPQTDSEELLKALNAIMQDEEYFNEPVANLIIQNYVKNIQQGDEISEKKPRNLTRREIQILKLISEGLTSKQIADGLFISVRTVETHKNNIMQKLGLKNTAQLIKFAIKHGYVKL